MSKKSVQVSIRFHPVEIAELDKIIKQMEAVDPVAAEDGRSGLIRQWAREKMRAFRDGLNLPAEPGSEVTA